MKSTLVTSSRRVVLWPGSTKEPSTSRSTILKDIERDFYMTAQQALDYGIVGGSSRNITALLHRYTQFHESVTLTTVEAYRRTCNVSFRG